MKQVSRIFCLLLFCASVMGALCGCADRSEDDTIYVTGAFAGPVSGMLPGYEISEQGSVKPDLLHTGLATEAYDIQAENFAAKYWYPLTLETVVIAVDHSQTDPAISSWGDLLDCGEAVGLPDAAPYGRMAVAALCFGLEGEGFTLNAAIGILGSLQREGRLALGDEAAPIRICFDSEAAARIKNGEDIEIIVPSGGTLTYKKGLLANRPLALPGDAGGVLAESGLRSIDGLCDETVYPAKNRYAPAETLKNYGHMSAVTQDWTRILRRDVLRVRLYTTADVREHNVLAAVFIIVTVIWVAGMMRRSRQGDIRQVILAVGLIIIGWVLTRYIKYELIDIGAASRYLWYCYYIFEALLPLCVVRIASLIGADEENRRAPKWFKALCALNIALAALVMTNDFHGMVFKLDPGPPAWSGDYSYEFFYYIIMAALVIELALGIVLMFIIIKHSPRRFGVVFPLIFIAALVVYCAGYSLRAPLFFESDMTLVMCVFALLFIEVCLRAGQIPINTHYREFFKNTGLKLQITDGGGNSIVASNDAEPLDARQWESLINSDGPVQIDADALLLKNRISGGYAVWREDIAFINRLKDGIAASNREIEAANALLSGEAKSKEQRARAKARIEFCSLFEAEISVHEKRLAGLLEAESADTAQTAESAEDTESAESAEDTQTAETAQYAENLKRAALLTCYIKRLSYFLVLKTDGHETVPFTELVVYIDEMAELARLAGIKCLSYCGLTGETGLERAILFYDFWASLLEWAVMGRAGEIILQTMSENGRLVMRVVTSGDAAGFELPEKTAREISAVGGAFEKTEDKEIGFTVLRLSFPEGGGRVD